MGKSEILITIILFNLVFIGFLVAIFVFIREYRIKKKKHLKQLKGISEAHKKELFKTQLEIQTHTMHHIGREIHDNVGQKLTLASLYIQQLIFEIAINKKFAQPNTDEDRRFHMTNKNNKLSTYDNKATQIKENLEEIHAIIDDSLSELRQVSKTLTDDSIKTDSISVLIKKECTKIANLKRCEVLFTDNFRNEILSYEEKSVLLRITQEFLQNSLKHAHANQIHVGIETSFTKTILTLKDDGKGFDYSSIQNKGIGLQNIKKRTELIGGNMQLESKENFGTKLIIEIPFKR